LRVASSVDATTPIAVMSAKALRIFQILEAEGVDSHLQVD